MKSRMMFSVLVMIATAGCSNQVRDKGWDVTVSGKVGFPGKGAIEIQELMQEEGLKDTIVLKGDYTYQKKLHLQEPGYYRINFYGLQSVDIILDKSNVEVNVDGNSQGGFMEVIGSPDYDLINEVQTLLQRAQSGPEIVAMELEFQKAAQSGNEQKMSELRERYMSYLSRSYDSLIVILRQKPVSLGMINLLEGSTFDKDKYFEFYNETASRLKETWPGSRHTAEFVKLVEKTKATAIGQKAPEIALPDQNGKIVKLTSLRGKYVLVDFWAKWCGPCRRENPNVVAAYNKFRDKGFEVFGVSLDRSREDWLRAIQEDGLTWTHVSDLKYFESQAALDYNISAIPFSILVDPVGIIIAKNLRGPALDKKLEEIFGKKS